MKENKKITVSLVDIPLIAAQGVEDALKQAIKCAVNTGEYDAASDILWTLNQLSKAIKEPEESEGGENE